MTAIPLVLTPEAAPTPSSVRRAARWTLVASSFGLAMAQLDMTAVNVAAPGIAQSLGTGVRGLSWVLDGYTLAFASLLLLSGGLGDRLGARRVFVAGLSLFTAASVLCGLAPAQGPLVFARILQGAGAALFMPSSLAILRQAYPDAVERARAIGVWSALTSITGAAGPLFGGLVAGAFGWRSIFLLNVPIGLVAVFMALRFVRASPRAAGKGFDLPAQITGALAVSAFAWALIEQSALGWGSPLILAALLAAALGVAAFIALEGRSADPILPLRLFANRTFASTSAAALLYAGGFFGSVLVYSLYFARVRGEPPAVAGLHLAAITASFALTSVLTGRLVARHGTRLPMIAGLLLLAASAWSFASLPGAAPISWLTAPLIAMGFGAGLVAPSMNAAILASVPQSLSGIGAGVLNAGRQVGTALGVAVFASFFESSPPLPAVRLSLACAGALYLGASLVASRADAPANPAAAVPDSVRAIAPRRMERPVQCGP